MTRNILIISVSDVNVKRLFFITRDVVIYRRNRFRDVTIERIMLIKKIKWFEKNNKNDSSYVLFVFSEIINHDELDNEETESITQWIFEEEIFDDEFNDFSVQKTMYNISVLSSESKSDYLNFDDDNTTRSSRLNHVLKSFSVIKNDIMRNRKQSFTSSLMTQEDADSTVNHDKRRLNLQHHDNVEELKFTLLTFINRSVSQKRSFMSLISNQQFRASTNKLAFETSQVRVEILANFNRVLYDYVMNNDIENRSSQRQLSAAKRTKSSWQSNTLFVISFTVNL